MTCEHTALLDLPTILESYGFAVDVGEDWDQGQCFDQYHYRWTDPHTGVGSHAEKPHAYMVHHTGGSAATPPDHQISKANGWLGLKRGDRLYQSGEGVPTLYLATAGPSRYSSGYGYMPSAWDYTFKQLRAPAHAEGPDGPIALNRYAFNLEVVHEGDGSAIDPDVWEYVVVLGMVLEDMFDLKEMCLGHTSWTQRKVDPRWSVGLPHDGRDAIMDIQDAIAKGETPVDLNCPWEDKCQQHYFPPTDLPLGTGQGQMQGQCNVPESQQEAVIWAFETRRFVAGNTYRYDYETVLTEGREMVLEYRDAT